ncbi:MAG TPA: carboxypeptidase-like regulatory domain-containing protein, partial [Pyrinomonadaceae bacterium]|nr:carboxypeptidase-like regulatory domain-containing protein [Pyrinomonadaceae bacterium]
MRLILLLCLAIFLSLPLLARQTPAGRIEGRITDPKGAGVPGATVTATNNSTKQVFTAIADGQGRYKVEALAPGTYSLKVSAKGFAEGQKENIKVVESSAAAVDVQLEIAPVEAQVKIGATKGNLDPIYQQLRQLGKTDQDFAGAYASVNNLKLQREAATFTLKSGDLYFLAPVEGRTTGAVFIGDGELSLVPPTQVEQNSLKIFTGEGGISEQFHHLVLRFTDKTFEEIKSSPAASMKSGGAAAGQARELYHDNQQLLRKRLRDNLELHTLADIYNQTHEGFFRAFI